MRFRPVLLAAALLFTASACGGDDAAAKQASCDKMKEAIRSIASLQAEENGTGDGDFSRIYSDAAGKIRAAADESDDGDVKSAGIQVSDALSQLAKAQTSDDPTGGPEALEASGKLATAAGTFERHCGQVDG